jgi:uncharacterized protein
LTSLVVVNTLAVDAKEAVVRQGMDTADILPEQMERYRKAAVERLERDQQAAKPRRVTAMAVAKQAARVLKDRYGATRVVLFGSLAHGAWFNPGSDIDLAAEGIPPRLFWKAWCALDRLQSSFEIELVAWETASARLRGELDRYGVDL